MEDKVRVVAQAFFDDMIGDADYPFKTVEEQYEEIMRELKEGNMHPEFIEHVYNMNKHRLQGAGEWQKEE